MNLHLLILKILLVKQWKCLLMEHLMNYILYYNHFVSAIQQMYGEEASSFNGYYRQRCKQQTSYEYEPSAEAVLEVLLTTSMQKRLIYGAVT